MGRLVADLKISAKELIRCKSYELGALVEKVLLPLLLLHLLLLLDRYARYYERAKRMLGQCLVQTPSGRVTEAPEN